MPDLHLLILETPQDGFRLDSQAEILAYPSPDPSLPWNKRWFIGEWVSLPRP